MHKVESRLRNALILFVGRDRYDTYCVKNFWIDARLLLLQWFVLSLNIISLIYFLTNDIQIFAIVALTLSTNVSGWVAFHTHHEWRHASFTKCLCDAFYVTCLVSNMTLVSSELSTYYIIGHLFHHKYNGRHRATDLIQRTTFTEIDADVIFWPIELKSPGYGTSDISQLLLCPIGVLWMSPLVQFPLNFVLAVKTMWNAKTYISRGVPVVATIVFKMVLATYLVTQKPYHAALIYIGGTLALYFASPIAAYVPLVHTDTVSSPECFRSRVESFLGTKHYPTHTPDFPECVHVYLFFGLTYHIEHHIFPEVPWYNLKVVHEDLESMLRIYAQHDVMNKCLRRTQPPALKTHKQVSILPEVAHVYRGMVIDLSRFYDIHPGSAHVFKGMRDITEAYTRNHGDDTKIRENLRYIKILGMLCHDQQETDSPAALQTICFSTDILCKKLVHKI